MVAYEFCSLDPKGGYQIFGVLPERRKSSERVTQESIMNWGKKIFGNDLGPKDISFVQVTLNENKGKSSGSLNASFRHGYAPIALGSMILPDVSSSNLRMTHEEALARRKGGL